MAKSFTPVWRTPKPGRSVVRVGVSDARTDTESGLVGDASQRRELYALKVMLDRGHMTPEEYARRRAAILGEDAKTGGDG